MEIIELKNIITGIKNSLDELNSRQQRIQSVNVRKRNRIQPIQTTLRKYTENKKKNKQSLRDLQDNNRRPNICIV